MAKPMERATLARQSGVARQVGWLVIGMQSRKHGYRRFHAMNERVQATNAQWRDIMGLHALRMTDGSSMQPERMIMARSKWPLGRRVFLGASTAALAATRRLFHRYRLGW